MGSLAQKNEEAPFGERIIMSGNDRVGTENRKQFKSLGARRVREMLRAGQFDADQRRPMSIWVAEQDAKSARLKRFAIIFSSVAIFVALFMAVLGAVG